MRLARAAAGGALLLALAACEASGSSRAGVPTSVGSSAGPTVTGSSAGPTVTGSSAGPTVAGSSADATTPSAVLPAATADRHGLVRCPAVPAAAVVPGGLPRLTLRCLGDGEPVTLSGLRGIPTLVNVWASWCGPCRGELPVLRDLAFATRGRLRVLGVAEQDQPADASALARAERLPYPSLLDPDGRLTLARAGLPVTVLVAPDGRVVRTSRGPLTAASARALVAAAGVGG